MSNAKPEWEREFATWKTNQLLKAITVEGEIYTDREVSLIKGELRNRNIAIPLKCPVCGLINPLRTSSCPVCGHEFSEGAKTITDELDRQLCSRCNEANAKEASECAHCGHPLVAALQTARMLEDNEEEIEALAWRALKGSLMCGLFPGYSFFLAPLAMGRAIDSLDALSELRKEYPDYRFRTSARYKALAALVVGVIVILLNLLAIGYLAGLLI